MRSSVASQIRRETEAKALRQMAYDLGYTDRDIARKNRAADLAVAGSIAVAVIVWLVEGHSLMALVPAAFGGLTAKVVLSARAVQAALSRSKGRSTQAAASAG